MTNLDNFTSYVSDVDGIQSAHNDFAGVRASVEEEKNIATIDRMIQALKKELDCDFPIELVTASVSNLHENPTTAA